MPLTAIPSHRLTLFHCTNPDGQLLDPSSTRETIVDRPSKPELPLLVFLHAAGANILGWRHQLSDPRLTNNFNVLLIDCPFHGFSEAEERPEHTLEDSADCVVELLDKLDVPPFAIYGEGVHGVNVALHVCLKRPEKVKGLLLASPGWRAEDAGVKSALMDIEEEMFVNKDGKGDGTGSLPAEALENITCYCIGDSARLAERRKEMAQYFQERYGTGRSAHDMRFLFTFIYNRNPIPAEQVATVTCPVLILRGSTDNIVCPESACEEWCSALSSARDGCKIHTISSATSNLSLVEGNILSRIMAKFFETCF
ncbi:hypothetical protein JCM10207_005105 [Rhodosporidiobolus poonsookiae]